MGQFGRTAVATILVLVFGIGLLAVGTDGFRAYTAEAARTIALNRTHPPFPAVTLQDSKGRYMQMSDLSGKYVLATFIYTSCGTVCPQLEMNMADVYEALPPAAIGRDIAFLSISFDPDRDTPEALAMYRHHFGHGHDEDNWLLARIPDKDELQQVLRTFGVIVIPGDNGDIAHNGAFYLFDRDGKLAEIMDYTDVDQAIAKVKRRIGQGA